MIPDLPFHVNLIFILTVLLTIWLLNRAVIHQRFFVVSTLWLLFIGILALRGFFLDYAHFPPHFILVILIPLLAITWSFTTKAGKRILDEIPLKPLVLISIVRIPVEIVLYLLFLNEQIPGLMTFAGRNFDMLAGISAPIVYSTCFRGQLPIRKTALLVWHFVSLGLLLNIVVNALLSAPFPFQQFGFDQPNKAVFYFPFVWLPGYIVMAVLFSHLVSIRNLLSKKS